jgi:hypothetical protein
MIRAVTVAMIPAWQVREKITLRAAFDKILSNRIARNALESLVQVRRLLGMCIVAGRVRGLAGLSAAAMAFRGRLAISARPSSDTCRGSQLAQRRVRESSFLF